jgi:hypothetical protein
MLCNNLDFVPIHRVDEMLILGLLYELKNIMPEERPCPFVTSYRLSLNWIQEIFRRSCWASMTLVVNIRSVAVIRININFCTQNPYL